MLKQFSRFLVTATAAVLLASCGSSGGSASPTVLPPANLNVAPQCTGNNCTITATWGQSDYIPGYTATYTITKDGATVVGPTKVEETNKTSNSVSVAKLTPLTSYVFSVYATNTKGQNSSTATEAFKTPAPGSSQIQWPNDGAGQLYYDSDTLEGEGSFPAATDTSGKKVTYTYVTSDPSANTGSVTLTCDATLCSVKLMGQFKVGTSITWSAVASDASNSPLKGKPITIENKSIAPVNGAYSYLTSASQATTLTNYLISSFAGLPKVTNFNTLLISYNNGIASKGNQYDYKNNVCDGTFWPHCFSALSGTRSFAGLINGPTQSGTGIGINVSTADASDVADSQGLSNDNNAWASAYQGITTDIEPFHCATEAGQYKSEEDPANSSIYLTSDNNLSYLNQLGTYLKSLGRTLSVYVNPKYLSDKSVSTGFCPSPGSGLTNAKELAKNLSWNSKNFIAIPLYAAGNNYITQALQNVKTAKLPFKIIINITQDDGSTFCANYLDKLNITPTDMKAYAPYFRGYILFNLNSSTATASNYQIQLNAANNFLTTGVCTQ